MWSGFRFLGSMNDRKSVSRGLQLMTSPWLFACLNSGTAGRRRSRDLILASFDAKTLYALE